jgi:hypothetical protein
VGSIRSWRVRHPVSPRVPAGVHESIREPLAEFARGVIGASRKLLPHAHRGEPTSASPRRCLCGSCNKPRIQANLLTSWCATRRMTVSPYHIPQKSAKTLFLFFSIFHEAAAATASIRCSRRFSLLERFAFLPLVHLSLHCFHSSVVKRVAL